MRFFSLYFWFSFSLFTINQLVEKAGIVIPYVHSYLDDLLAPGIVLGFALAFQQQFTFRSKTYILAKGHVIFFVFWYALLFEVVFPYFDARHHADPLDVVAYTVGGILYFKLGNLKVKKLLLKPYGHWSAN